MINISTLRAMAAAGASVDVILAAVEAELVAEGERVQARRVIDADRQRRKRHADGDGITPRHAESRNVTRSHADAQASLTSLLSSSESTTKIVESKKERARKSHLPADWKPKPSHYELARKYGKSETTVDMQADALRDWAGSKAIMRASWDQTFNGFLRPRENTNGNDRRSVIAAADRLLGSGFILIPIPGAAVPTSGQANLQLLSKG